MAQAPKYRGTMEELRASQDDARDWMINQCMAAISDSYDDIRDEIEVMLNEAISSNTSGFYQDIDRQRSGGYSVFHHEYSDYFYVWRIGSSVQHARGEQKLVLRKDGSIHTENLKSALTIWARRRISGRMRRNVLETNKRIYADFGSPADGKAQVTLSKTEIKRCQVEYRRFHVTLGPVRCEIKDISSVISEMDVIAALYDEAMSRFT